MLTRDYQQREVMLSQKELQKLLTYNPETGVFTRKISLNYNCPVGSNAGCLDIQQGYVKIYLASKSYKAHRLAFLYMTGEVPEFIDHKDRDKANNSWNNLREVTKSQNQCNTGLRKDNKTGVKGLSWIDKKGKIGFQTRVAFARNYRCSWFSVREYGTKELAKQAAIDWLISSRLELHGEFSYDN